MKARTSRFQSTRGSFLLASFFAVTILSIIAVAMLDFSYNTFQQTVRKETVEKLRVVANNELEYLFYKWTNEVDEPAAMTVEARLASESLGAGFVATTEANVATAELQPFLVEDQAEFTTGRSLYTLPLTALGVVRDENFNDGIGIMASIGYFRAKSRVIYTHPKFGQMEVKSGRRFAFQKSSPFNFAMFYEGELELNPLGNFIINGDVQSNSDIYMGTRAGSSLTVAGNIYYHGKFNGATTDLGGTQKHKYSNSTYLDPIFDRNPDDAQLPIQTQARESQLQKIQEKSIYVGNVDPQAVYNAYSALNPSPYPTLNDVNRSIIAPPPTDSVGTLLPEDPTVASNRLYNKASIRIEISTNNSGEPVVSAYDKAGNNITSLIQSAIPSKRVPVYDKREGKDVLMTSLNVGELNNAIESNDSLSSIYNGVVYIHDKGQQTDSTHGYGIRLDNAELVPNANEKGFVLASDNGVYIQGNFNTTNTGSGETARCAIMGDAITVLSDGWNDANSTNDAIPTSAGQDTSTLRIASGDSTINSAIVSGNTASVSGSSGANSGGAHNLVRYLEDWSGRSSVINGSLGQMYTSKYFNSFYRANGSVDQVYQNPATRILNFDTRLAEKPPSGAPASTTRYYRGEIIRW